VLQALVKRLWVRLVDRDGDGRCTPAELEGFFERFDANGDGELQLSELKAAFAARVGGEASELVLEQMLSNLSRDGSASVNRAQLSELLLDPAPPAVCKTPQEPHHRHSPRY